MGEITTTNHNLSVWLHRIESSRQQLIEAAKTGNRVLAAFAQAEARADLIESVRDEYIAARLLRITDPDLSMVELANSPTDADRIRVCAIAILSGFEPGRDEFAIFGAKGKPGKLYVKEPGFRRLFGWLGLTPDVAVGHPEWSQLGKGGKHIWRVSGSASVTYRGEVMSVSCDGDMAIGLPGYETDNVAGIQAKARRRLLQMLWMKVSPILTGDHVDDDVTGETMISQPAAIDSDAVTRPAAQTDSVDDTPLGRVKSRLKDQPEKLAVIVEAWKSFEASTTADELECYANEFKARLKAVTATDGDKKELLALHAQRKAALK